MTGALTYLILTSARGRLRTQLARLRNPRYALALALGILYVWGVYLRPRPHSAAEIFGGGFITLAPLLALAYVTATWLFGADRTALAFSEAEAAMLFTAPVSRRALVMYKIARTQIAILTTSLIWTIIFHRGSTLPLVVIHVISYWVVLSTLNLNRLGVALVRASSGEHGLRGARKNWLPIAVFTVVLAMVLVPLGGAVLRIVAANFEGASEILRGATESTSASIALLPFNLLLAPTVAAPGREWLGAIVPALLMLVLMVFWVLSTDAAFEEAASEASARHAQKVAALRASREGTSAIPVLSAGRTIPLASTGAPAVAILWKNAVWMLRTRQIRGLLIPPAIAFVCVAVFAQRDDNVAMLIAVASLIVAFVRLLIGPLSMRNDLRSALLHLSLLKTIPLRGRDIVLAEVASSAIPMAITQYLLVVAALWSLGYADTGALTVDMRTSLALMAPVLLLGLNGALFMAHNGLALLFPGWVKLGATGATGIETIGMGMMSMLVVVFTLALLLITPVIVGGIAWALLSARMGLALFTGGLLGGLILLGESVLLTVVLGRALDRLEPLEVG